jgi:thiol-disulfide isomerase/thioredoxin
MVGVLTVLAMLCAVGPTPAQELAPVDIANEGAAMEQAAEQGDFEQVFLHAARILGAAGTDLEGRTPDELWYIGLAHQYLMAQAMDAAVAAGLPGERGQTARVMADAVLRPYEDIREVSYGEPIELTDYLVPGQYVIFDFFSEYCGPCMQFAPLLEKLATERADIVLVSVNINRPEVRVIDGESPVARQYNLRSIPHFKIYGPDGEMVAEGDEARAMIVQWLGELEG